MDVQLAICRQVVADDQRDLLDVDPPAPQIGRDQDAGGSRPELVHDHVAFFLVHLPVHRADGKVVLLHLFGEPVDFLPGVAKDDGLRDRHGVVEVTEGVEFPFLLFDGDEKLLDALQGQLVALHQDLDGVVHEFAGHFQDRGGEGRAHQDDLAGGREESVDVVDLFLEAPREHLVGLVQDHCLQTRHVEGISLDQVVDTAGRPRNDLDPAPFQFLQVVSQRLSSNAGVAIRVHEIPEGLHHPLALLGEFPCRA
mmetsp:Transcript_8675/g.18131  ORF Transcript_8675/g.18131 Transcript_8675/m.18131 type:complete len:253 (+) Transcript_8675:834-1592(+)